MMELNKIYNMDCLEGLKMLPDNSVDCCVTSPPYWGLRDYGNSKQLGMESTPELFVSNMVYVFDQVRRVLKPTGSLWLNLGDSYAASGRGGGGGSFQDGDVGTKVSSLNNRRKPPTGFKPKDLVGIPWMVAFALRSAGWYLREEIIWHKPNPMPESVKDRCTRAHEQIFHLTKSGRYYHDAEAIKTPSKDPADDLRRLNQQLSSNKSNPDEKQNGLRPRMDKQSGHSRRHAGFNDRWDHMTTAEQMSMGANKRSVWTIATKPFRDAHFATFPEDLIEDPIKASCPENGTVLDPFMGAGTTAVVAAKLNRNYIGFELNPDYIKIADKRLQKELGLFNKAS